VSDGWQRKDKRIPAQPIKPGQGLLTQKPLHFDAAVSHVLLIADDPDFVFRSRETEQGLTQTA
jgi:hypothetical protein